MSIGDIFPEFPIEILRPVGGTYMRPSNSRKECKPHEGTPRRAPTLEPALAPAQQEVDGKFGGKANR